MLGNRPGGSTFFLELEAQLVAAHDNNRVNETALLETLQRLNRGEALSIIDLNCIFGVDTIFGLNAAQEDHMAIGGKATTVRVYIRHHNDPEKKFQPQDASCQGDAEKGRTGCGGQIRFYITYPNQKRMPFDGEARVVPGTEVNMGDGAIVASVYSDNVHFSTCPHRAENESRRRESLKKQKGAA